MKKIKHLMIWIGLLLSLVSCKDTMEAIGLGGDEIPAEGLVLNLQLTNFTKQQIGTRAGASETFNSLWRCVLWRQGQILKPRQIAILPYHCSLMAATR